MSLHHLVREPKVRLDKNPAIILLHGYGSNEEDLFSFATELPDEYFVISARAPYDMYFDKLNLNSGSYAWYAINFDADENKFSDLDQARSSRDLIVDFIDECIAKYAIDSDKVTLIGFSQGAILSSVVALSYPEKVNSVVALSGYLNLDIAKENYKEKDISKLKFFVSHGVVDQVIPIDWARKTKPTLDRLGIDVVYKEYPIGHGVAPQNFYDFRDWLKHNN